MGDVEGVIGIGELEGRAYFVPSLWPLFAEDAGEEVDGAVFVGLRLRGLLRMFRCCCRRTRRGVRRPGLDAYFCHDVRVCDLHAYEDQ